MSQTITKESHNHRIEAKDTVDQRIVSNKEGKRYTPSGEAIVRQRARMQVNIPAVTKGMLSEVFRDRLGQSRIMGEAETMNLDPEDKEHFAFYWLSREPENVGKKHTTVPFSPTEKLMQRARYFHLSPHILVRAAAVKVALAMQDAT